MFLLHQAQSAPHAGRYSCLCTIRSLPAQLPELLIFPDLRYPVVNAQRQSKAELSASRLLIFEQGDVLQENYGVSVNKQAQARHPVVGKTTFAPLLRPKSAPGNGL